MNLPVKLISTDFDGTLHTETENPPVPAELERIIARLQRHGAKWVINTGRDLGSLQESLTRARLTIQPDFVVVVEREIYRTHEAGYSGVAEWNERCSELHGELFQRVRPRLPEILGWINARYRAAIYEDAYSPFCLIAENAREAGEIHDYLDGVCAELGELVVMRNDIYARFSHKAFNKGTALAEIARRLGISREHVFAAGDHLNDLPMLSTEYARWLVAPRNAIDSVKEAVLRQNGCVSERPCGHGVAQGLREICEAQGFALA